MGTNTMFNVYSPKSSKDRRYFLTDATREELEKGRAEPDEEYYELKESILAISEDFHVQ